MLITRWLAGFIAGIIVSLSFSQRAAAIERSILIISDTGSPIHEKVIKELTRHETANAMTLEQIHTADASAEILRGHALIITLGHDAAIAGNQSEVPTLNALLSRHSINDSRLCIVAPCQSRNRHYAIYLDQPLSRQLNLLTTILPNAHKIGVLIGDVSAEKLPFLRQETANRGLTLITMEVSSPDDLHHLSAELSKQADVILALPDPTIHNRETVPYLLLTSYRYSIPLIGFSEAYVNAGAISAVSSSPDEIARHILDLADAIVNSGKEPEQRINPPKYFSVYTNENVARSLEIRLPNKEDIRMRLIQLEK